MWIAVPGGLLACFIRNIVAFGGVSTSTREAARLGRWGLLISVPMVLLCLAGIAMGLRVWRGRPALPSCSDKNAAWGLLVVFMALGAAYGGLMGIVAGRLESDDGAVTGPRAVWTGMGILLFAVLVGFLGVQLLRGKVDLPDEA